MHTDHYPIIRVIEEAFEIPQLKKKRRITALLPSDYEESNESYPVLYLQDGQNLFDDNAPFGSWGIDRTLAKLREQGLGKIIIIAIDHGKKERMKEYLPFLENQFGPGDGKKYLRFVTDTLKPYVDKKYRTLPDREHTGLGGSSLGGLISIYGGIIYPEVYGRLMVFSPALWITPNIRFEGIHFFNPLPTKIYVYAGGKESETMVPNVHRFLDAIERQGLKQKNIEFKLSVDDIGEHKEYYWGREFPTALNWLFFEEKSTDEEE